MKRRKFLSLFLFFTFTIAFLFIINSPTTFAETTDDEIFTKTFGDYQDQKLNYSIDYIDTTELEDESIWDKLDIFDNVSDWAVSLLYDLVHGIFVEFPFMLIRVLTGGLIWIFDKVYEVNFVNSMVDGIASSVQNIAGISGIGFGKTGLFGAFLGIITLSIAVYTLYQFLVKKASISAFSGLLKSLVCLSLALLFFSNYSTIIKGLNSLSVETSGYILSANTVANDNGVIENKSLKKQMEKTIWNTFVHKPYLMLQYGSMNESKIGKDRILSLLKEKPDTDKRYEMVKKEVQDKGNDMMTRGKIFERSCIIVVTFVANIVNAIPVLLLSFGLIFFQFWFTVMGMIAPFAFLISAFPNQFKVMGRYLVELITPLVLKIAIAVISLFIFSITSIVTNVSTSSANNGGLLGYIFMVFCQAILLFTLWLIRNRIISIFAVGSRELQSIKQGMTDTFKYSSATSGGIIGGIKGTFQGGLSGGIKGAIRGVAQGSEIGSMLAGEQGVKDTLKDMALSKMYMDRLNSGEDKSDSKLNNLSQKLPQQQQTNDNQQMNQKDEQKVLDKEQLEKLENMNEEMLNRERENEQNNDDENINDNVPLENMDEVNEKDDIENPSESANAKKENVPLQNLKDANKENNNNEIDYDAITDNDNMPNTQQINESDNDTQEENVPLESMTGQTDESDKEVASTNKKNSEQDVGNQKVTLQSMTDFNNSDHAENDLSNNELSNKESTKSATPSNGIHEKEKLVNLIEPGKLNLKKSNTDEITISDIKNQGDNKLNGVDDDV